jgi:hypothetical protein
VIKFAGGLTNEDGRKCLERCPAMLNCEDNEERQMLLADCMGPMVVASGKWFCHKTHILGEVQPGQYEQVVAAIEAEQSSRAEMAENRDGDYREIRNEQGDVVAIFAGGEWTRRMDKECFFCGSSWSGCCDGCA